MGSEEFRNRVRQLRFEKGQMTQRQLAEEVGVTRQTIITIEANRYSPSLKLAFRIARTFGSSIEDVFQYSQPGDRAGASEQQDG
jgi:putative transcriptional regulator